jgi:hypothetical protein
MASNDWYKHFEWQGPVLAGRSPTGRATVELLQINLSMRVELREWLMQSDVFPTNVEKT